MQTNALERLIEFVGWQLAGHGFCTHWHYRMTGLACAAFWRRCTFNINRAVAVLQRPDTDFEIGPYCQKMKWRLFWLTRFVPFFYEVGLQIVLSGDGLEKLLENSPALESLVDRSSNQLVVLQSIFVVDTTVGKYDAARTWGQVITGKYQDAIAAGIEEAGFSAMKTD